MPRKFDVRLLPESCKGCGICVHFCPAGVLEMSGEFTPKGYHPARKRPGAQCTGCRSCELLCPDFAIFIEEATGAGPKAQAPTPAAPRAKRFPAKPGKVTKGRGKGRGRK